MRPHGHAQVGGRSGEPVVDRRVEAVVLQSVGCELTCADLVRATRFLTREREGHPRNERERDDGGHDRPRAGSTTTARYRRGVTPRGHAHERRGRVDRLRRDPNDRHRFGQSLQLDGASLLVADAIHPPGQVRDLWRREHLAGTRLTAQPRREVQRPSSEPALDGNGLARVEADPDGQEQVGVRDRLGDEALLQIERGADRLARRGEDRERFVAPELDHGSVTALDALARDARELGGQLRGGLVTSFLGEQGVPADVGDQERADRGADAIFPRRSARLVRWVPCHRWGAVSPGGHRTA